MDIPVRFSRTPGSIRRLAPRMNEHREEIVEEANRQSASAAGAKP
jgi:crotonobetainyl-CoA:carnitine CoA-transferase CaiB-like acyl-CoA transferase